MWSVALPAPVTAMDLLHHRARNWKVYDPCLKWRHSPWQGAIVALANGEVRLYQDKNVVSQLQFATPIHAVKFGRFGKDDGALGSRTTTHMHASHHTALVSATGELTVKQLSKDALLSDGDFVAGPPSEQFTKIKVPPKTQLYLEQTQRERDNCVHMHRLFQADLAALRLSAGVLCLW